MFAISKISAVLTKHGIHGADRYALLGGWWALHWKSWSGFFLEAPFLFAPFALLMAAYEEYLEPLVPPPLLGDLLGFFVFWGGLLVGAELVARLFYLPRIQELQALIEVQQPGSDGGHGCQSESCERGIKTPSVQEDGVESK